MAVEFGKRYPIIGFDINAKRVQQLAEGRDSGIMDLLIVATRLDLEYLVKLVSRAEEEIKRKIRYIHYASEEQIPDSIEGQAYLLLWEK